MQEGEGKEKGKKEGGKKGGIMEKKKIKRRGKENRLQKEGWGKTTPQGEQNKRMAQSDRLKNLINCIFNDFYPNLTQNKIKKYIYL